MATLEEKRKKLEEAKKRNIARQQELEKLRANAETMTSDPKPEDSNDPDYLKDLANKYNQSSTTFSNDKKKQTELLQEKMNKTKKEIILEEQDIFKTEYLAAIKPTSESEAQCEIWEKPDFKNLFAAKIEQNNTKKVKPVRFLLRKQF